MKILGLDCASKTGWCVYDSEQKKIIESGVQDFRKKRGESNGLMFLKFRKWLNTMIRHNKIEIIGYEQAHFRGGSATEICVGLQTRCQECAVDRDIESAPVKTTTLKKFATGKGNAGKDEMIYNSIPLLGRDPIDDNEADAVHVALWVSDEYC